jgi:hypothetical protein
MKKTDFTTVDVPTKRWTDMDKMVSDFDALERNLRDLRTILTLICLQQDDKTLNVPLSALLALPAGTQLEVSVDRIHGNYVFKAIPADPGT